MIDLIDISKKILFTQQCCDFCNKPQAIYERIDWQNKIKILYYHCVAVWDEMIDNYSKREDINWVK